MIMTELAPTAVLSRVSLFAGLSPDMLERVAALAQRRSLAASSLLWSRGEQKDALVVLLTGRMRAVLYNDEGREITLATFAPLDFLGEMSILDHTTHSATVETIEPCQILWIPGEAIRRLMSEQSPLLWHLLQLQTDRVRRLSDELASHAFLSTCRRVARKLLQCAGEAPRADISHQELASLIGSTRESVTRALSDLERRGLIETGKQKVRLKDKDGLRALLDEL